jgi:hypothetical protein
MCAEGLVGWRSGELLNGYDRVSGLIMRPLDVTCIYERVIECGRLTAFDSHHSFLPSFPHHTILHFPLPPSHNPAYNPKFVATRFIQRHSPCRASSAQLVNQSSTKNADRTLPGFAAPNAGLPRLKKCICVPDLCQRMYCDELRRPGSLCVNRIVSAALSLNAVDR